MLEERRWKHEKEGTYSEVMFIHFHIIVLFGAHSLDGIQGTDSSVFVKVMLCWSADTHLRRPAKRDEGATPIRLCTNIDKKETFTGIVENSWKPRC